MAKMINAKGSKGNSGYLRVIGNEQLAILLSKVQSTIISNGNELEKIIIERSQTIDNLDEFIDKVKKKTIKKGTFLCNKDTIKKAEKYQVGIKNEPDMLIFIVNSQTCKIIELKDGANFDTKKSAGEKTNLINFQNALAAKIPFELDYFICSFNQDDKEKIYLGMKKKFEIEHILTGKELCEILGISFEEIVNLRNQDVKENFDYFIDELLKIPEAKKKIIEKLKEK